MSEVLVISSSDEALTEAPLAFIDAIVTGQGGYIKIEPNCPPPKVLWTLKSALLAIGIGFQWATITKLVENGMHGELAEAHVTGMLNKLLDLEVPPLPSKEDMAALSKEFQASGLPKPPVPDDEDETEDVE